MHLAYHFVHRKNRSTPNVRWHPPSKFFVHFWLLLMFNSICKTSFVCFHDLLLLFSPCSRCLYVRSLCYLRVPFGGNFRTLGDLVLSRDRSRPCPRQVRYLKVLFPSLVCCTTTPSVPGSVCLECLEPFLKPYFSFPLKPWTLFYLPFWGFVVLISDE